MLSHHPPLEQEHHAFECECRNSRGRVLGFSRNPTRQHPRLKFYVASLYLSPRLEHVSSIRQHDTERTTLSRSAPFVICYVQDNRCRNRSRMRSQSDAATLRICKDRADFLNPCSTPKRKHRRGLTRIAAACERCRRRKQKVLDMLRRGMVLISVSATKSSLSVGHVRQLAPHVYRLSG